MPRQFLSPEQQVVHFLLLQCCSSGVSAGDLGKGVQGSCWLEKILGYEEDQKEASGAIRHPSLRGTTCFHVLATFVKVKMASGLETWHILF